jgi:hypothetical protein
MSTNFYTRPSSCPHCGHAAEPWHVGKLSKGRRFLWNLHRKDEGQPQTVAEWIAWLKANPGCLVSEYDDPWSVEVFLDLVEKNQGGQTDSYSGFGFEGDYWVSYQEFS